MKNADMPAMPIELNGYGNYKPESYTGLTKREIFALHAPEIPEWFKNDWEKSNNENSEFFVLANAYSMFSKADYQYHEITIKGQMALMKSWCYAYADTMTSED